MQVPKFKYCGRIIIILLSGLLFFALLVSYTDHLLLLDLEVWNYKNIENLWNYGSTIHNKSKTENNFIVFKYDGRTGNHFYIYAAAYGLARKTNRIPVTCYPLKTFKDLLKSPNIPILSGTRCDINILNISQHFQELNPLYYDVGLIQKIRKSTSRTISIGGYFQNVGYFAEYEDEIRKELQLTDKYIKYANRYLHSVAKQKQHYTERKAPHHYSPATKYVFIGVHIRRNDFLTQEGQFIPGQIYFNKAMNYFRDKYGKDVLFSVATDDPEWADANLKGDDVYLTGNQGTNEDFAIAAACNHTILSIGTFGWWMGYLAGGEVVYPKVYTGRPFLKKWYLEGQMYPSHWIKM